MSESLRKRAYRVLNPGEGDDRSLDTFIIILIALNVLAVVLETEPAAVEGYETWFTIFELGSTIFFTVEYLARLWVCVEDERYAHPVKGRLRYSVTVMAIIDLLAIAPFYLQFIKMDLRIVRAIRLMRLVRILKMGRYAHAVRTLSNVIVQKKEELAMTTFVASMTLVLSASMIFFAEFDPTRCGLESALLAQYESAEACNAAENPFRSIPESMWWTVVTLTSVGYGDMVPQTGFGKFMAAIVCLFGVLLVALPSGIIASGFLEEMRLQRRGQSSDGTNTCPHCGKSVHLKHTSP